MRYRSNPFKTKTWTTGRFFLYAGGVVLLVGAVFCVFSARIPLWLTGTDITLSAACLLPAMYASDQALRTAGDWWDAFECLWYALELIGDVISAFF